MSPCPHLTHITATLRVRTKELDHKLHHDKLLPNVLTRIIIYHETMLCQLLLHSFHMCVILTLSMRRVEVDIMLRRRIILIIALCHKNKPICNK